MNARIFAIFMLLVLVLGSTGSIHDINEEDKPNLKVIDIVLQEKLHEIDDNIEVIIQFKSEVGEKELDLLKDLDFEIKKKYTYIDAVFAVGSKDGIKKLSNYENIFWIEFNELLEYALHETTSVVKATNAWNSILRDRYGRILKETDYGNEYINGEGVGVAVIDTGVDGGHPDFDYDQGKTICYKYDGSNWYKTENSDTSSGHGTHCGGISTGNGDASSGARKGTAPGATLIGLGVGDLLFINFGLDAYEWVYEHTRPDANEMNIRVVSNSWGTAGREYDPNDSITIIAGQLAWDNNVVSVFAAGNSGGDGSDIQTNPYGNIPVVINVAALTHDGTGVADFSSRGQADKEETWPDIGAPGVNIWATAPRGTIIDGAERTSNGGDIYYMAISGTSMATPHIAGIVGLLFQAAPHMRMTDIHDGYSGNESDDWYGLNETQVHEAEIILEITANLIDSGVEAKMGTYNHPHDYAQGHGLVDVETAVGVALTLEEMRTRDENEDGIPDFGEVTVFQAYDRYMNLGISGNVSNSTIANDTYEIGYTNTLKTSWKGEWAHFTDDDDNSFSTNNAHFVYIPNGSTKVLLDLQFTRFNAEKTTVSDIDITCDWDDDGINDLTPSPNVQGNKHYEIDVDPQFSGKHWTFGVSGQAYGGKYMEGATPEEFWEPLVAFNINFRAILEGDILIDNMPTHARESQLDFGEPTQDYTNTTTIQMLRHIYDVSKITEEDVVFEPKEEDEDNLGFIVGGLLAVIACMVVVILFQKRKN